MTARVVLHLPDRFLTGFAKGKPPLLYGRIVQTLAARGVTADLAPDLPTAQARNIQDGNLHILENGRVHAQGWLNSATAYLEGFFHVDPQGVQAASSIAARPYDPTQISTAEATAFATLLNARFTSRRHSRYKQRSDRTHLPTDAIAVFLQGPAPILQGQAFCSFEDMLRATAQNAMGRAVLVKPHPLKPDLGAEIIAKIQAEGHAITATDANVHDILAACALTVSINSATALEGYLHEKPAVIFGRSDFHALVETATSPQDFPRAMQAALTSPRDYKRALTWYFGQNCLDIHADHFDDRLLAIFAQAGFPADKLGL
ncbi:MAG: hypothetical protein ACOH2M_31250 [Cypionkella sp.]